MTDSIIVAIITATASILCQLLINHKNRVDTIEESARKDQKLTDRLEDIEYKLDIHNGYAEKLGGISKSIAVIETEIKNIKENMTK